MKPPVSDETLAAINGLLFRGEKIAAIKLYRESTGCELKEAKTEVDAIESALRSLAPEKFPAPRPVPRWLAVFILIDLLVVAGVLLWLLSRR